MRISESIAIRAVASKRSLWLITLCVCLIVSAVALMGFERPRDAMRRSAPPGEPVSPISVAARNKPSPAAFRPTESEPAVTLLSARAGATAEAASVPAGIMDLLIPVSGISANQLRDSFYDSRSEGRIHEALDIMAPRDTPVLAALDGAVMKLHWSDRGGIMLYQSDPSGSYVFYYGHLSRYADGISEGKKLKRGDLIAYVGDTGNAGAGNFHLHFGISKMTAAGRWYGGEAINPYPLLQGKR